MTISMTERLAIIRRAEAGWVAYQEQLAALTVADLERPDTVGFWTGRDLIAHIACWERHCAWLLDQWDAGRERLYSYDFDQADMERWDLWNEEQVTPFRSLPLDEVLQVALRTHFQALTTVAASPSVDEAFLGGMTWAHYEWHADDVRGCAGDSRS